MTDYLAAYHKAMEARDVPREPLAVYDSNSWRRVGLARDYHAVMIPVVNPADRHPDISGVPVLHALVCSVQRDAPCERSACSRSCGRAGEVACEMGIRV